MTKVIQRFSLFIAFIISTTLFTPIQSLASGNILVNGDALNGLEGWTTIDKCWKTSKKYERISSDDLPFFYPKGFKDKDGARTYIYQDVDIKNYVGKNITLSAFVRGWDYYDPDEKILLLQLFDANNNTLFSRSSTATNYTSWHEKTVTTTIPNKAVRARVSLIAVYHRGDEADAYFKNVKLVVDQYSATPSNPSETPSNTNQNTPSSKPSNPPATTSNPNQNTPSSKPSNPPATTSNPNQNTPPAMPSNLSETYSDILSETGENDTMMVVYLKKGDEICVGGFVDGDHYENCNIIRVDRFVVPNEPIPEGWIKSHSRVIDLAYLYSKRNRPNYGPGFWLRGLCKGEAVLYLEARSKKTKQETILKLRVIVVD